MATKLQTVERVLDELPSGLALLRQPFRPHQISKLPKETKAQAEQRKKDQASSNWPAKCNICQGYHHPKAVHLDYVGHAALTDRLLDCDPNWSWEPMGTTPEGLPAINGGLWIKLTVCGVSRYGFGAADGKSGGDAIKEMIGDALRNAAMRFGAALDLWHKGDLHLEEDEGPKADATQDGGNPTGDRLEGDMSNSALRGSIKTLIHNINGCGTLREFEELLETEDATQTIEQCKRRFPAWWETGAGCPAEFTPLKKILEDTRQGLKELYQAEVREYAAANLGEERNNR